MTTSYSQLGEPLASEVTATLIDLSVLVRRACQVARDHAEAGEDIAQAMLKRLLLLCKAEYGAVLLREEGAFPEQAEPGAQAITAKAFRALALHNIQGEKMSALLTAFPLGEKRAASPDSLASPDETCWLIYRLSLTEGVNGEGSIGHNGNDEPGVIPQVLLDSTEQARYALLVLGWVNEQDGECALLVSRSHALLPLVASIVVSIITGILLKERVGLLERKATREALNGMEVLKAELLGTVSHELRSPLASIKGYAATLLRHERRLARDERRQFLLAINEASDRLEVIIERLLEVSQFETGQVEIERSPVDMARLAREAISSLEERVATASPGRFLFSVHLEDAEDATSHVVPPIMADPRRLREVLDNLLENAIKFSPEGGLIRVTIRPVHKMLEMCIADTGQGIPVDHLDRIFERFHRVDTRLTREVNGLGLGLTICKHIIELHNGTIWAENRPHGKGSAFYVRLPLEDIL